MLSDAINYGFADVNLNFLGSGRLGIDRVARYFEGIEEFRQVEATQDLEAARHWFEQHWPGPVEDANPTVINELDAAAEEEFGFTMTKIVDLLRGAQMVGLDLESEPKVMPLRAFIETLERELLWGPERVRTAIEGLALRSRSQFMQRGHEPEIYPWRFNRNLSYVRRPFILRMGTLEEESSGVLDTWKSVGKIF
jgi:hypothetical protein